MARGMFGSLGDAVLDKSVNSTDVAIGVAAGIAGAALGKWASGKIQTMLTTTKDASGKAVPNGKTGLPAWAMRSSPAIGAVLVGGGLYYYEAKRKGNKSKGTAYLIGAAGAGVTLAGWDYAKKQFPSLAALVYSPGAVDSPFGALVPTRPMFGMLYQDSSTPRLAGAYADVGGQSLGQLAAAFSDPGGDPYDDPFAALVDGGTSGEGS